MTGIERHGASRAVSWLHHYLADDATVLVALLPLYPHVFVEDQARQVLLGSLSVGLRFLRRVDTLEANRVLLAVGIEQGYRVAIGNADHAAGQGVGLGGDDQ